MSARPVPSVATNRPLVVSWARAAVSPYRAWYAPPYRSKKCAAPPPTSARESSPFDRTSRAADAAPPPLAPSADPAALPHAQSSPHALPSAADARSVRSTVTAPV